MAIAPSLGFTDLHTIPEMFRGLVEEPLDLLRLSKRSAAYKEYQRQWRKQRNKTHKAEMKARNSRFHFKLKADPKRYEERLARNRETGKLRYVPAKEALTPEQYEARTAKRRTQARTRRARKVLNRFP